MKLTAYLTKLLTHEMKQDLKREFNIIHGETINGEIVVEANQQQYNRLLKAQELGYIQIRNKQINK